MKKIFASTSLIVLCTSIFTLGLGLGDGIKSVQARKDEDRGRDRFECTAAELSGNYGVLSTGKFVQAPEPLAGPFAAVGRLTVNANNTFSLTLRQNFNGTIFPPAKFIGNFRVDSDCTGTLTLADQGQGTIIFDFVAVDEGREIQFMRSQDSPGTKSVITGVATKQES